MLLRTFSALRHRDFLLLWCAGLVSAIGTWMHLVAQALLVLELTHGSSVALGTVSLAFAMSFFLFALVGGGVADRFDRSRLLIVTQTALLFLALLLGVLTARHMVRVWMVVAIAFCTGVTASFDQPTRAALVSSLVPKQDLMNAISLQSVAFTAASVIGPALAGIVLGRFGFAINFFLNAASYLGVIAVLIVIRVPKTAEAAATPPLRIAIAAALRTVAADDALPWILSGFGVLVFVGPSMTLLLPIFLRQVLHQGAARLGLLFCASGAGSVAGGLTVASLGDFRHKGVLFLIGVAAWPVAMGLLSASDSFATSMGATFLVGAAQTVVSSTTVTLMQTRVPPPMRGRVMSLNTLLMMGIRPLGDFPASALIAAVGAPYTAAFSAVVVGAYGAFLLFLRPAVRRS